MGRDFREIDALACEGGVKAIMDEAEWHDENLACWRRPRIDRFCHNVPLHN